MPTYFWAVLSGIALIAVCALLLFSLERRAKKRTTPSPPVLYPLLISLLAAGFLLSSIYAGLYFLQSKQAASFASAERDHRLLSVFTEALDDPVLAAAAMRLVKMPIIYPIYDRTVTFKHTQRDQQPLPSSEECLSGQSTTRFVVRNTSNESVTFPFRSVYTDISEGCGRVVLERIEIARKGKVIGNITWDASTGGFPPLKQCIKELPGNTPATMCCEFDVALERLDEITITVRETVFEAEVGFIAQNVRYPAVSVTLAVTLPDDLLIDYFSARHPAAEASVDADTAKLLETSGKDTSVGRISARGVLPYQALEIGWRPMIMEAQLRPKLEHFLRNATLVFRGDGCPSLEFPIAFVRVDSLVVNQQLRDLMLVSAMTTWITKASFATPPGCTWPPSVAPGLLITAKVQLLVERADEAWGVVGAKAGAPGHRIELSPGDVSIPGSG